MFTSTRQQQYTIKAAVICLALVAALFSEASVVSATYDEPVTFDNDYNNKVKIELYYMPQCPGCRQLITTSFNDAFHTPGFSEMADVTFIPFGNAREQVDGQRVFDNVMEVCALDKIGRTNQDLQFQYIDCIDHSKRRDASKVDRECARDALGLSKRTIQDIEDCASPENGNTEGNDLARRMVVQTESLTPSITYFPWIVVNRVHSQGIESCVWESLFNYVCNIYTGSNKSSHCPPIDEDDDDEEDDEDILEQL